MNKVFSAALSAALAAALAAPSAAQFVFPFDSEDLIRRAVDPSLELLERIQAQDRATFEALDVPVLLSGNPPLILLIKELGGLQCQKESFAGHPVSTYSCLAPEGLSDHKVLFERLRAPEKSVFHGAEKTAGALHCRKSLVQGRSTRPHHRHACTFKR